MLKYLVDVYNSLSFSDLKTENKRIAKKAEKKYGFKAINLFAKDSDEETNKVWLLQSVKVISFCWPSQVHILDLLFPK